VAKEYSRIHGRIISPDENVAVTAGATAAILSTLMAFVQPGDEVIIIEPMFNLFV
jgi:aspartate/methionine/tyrosine aminotransferase